MKRRLFFFCLSLCLALCAALNLCPVALAAANDRSHGAVADVRPAFGATFESVAQAFDLRREGPLLQAEKAWRLFPLFSDLALPAAVTGRTEIDTAANGRTVGAAGAAGDVPAPEQAGEKTLCVMGDTFGVRLFVEGVFIVEVEQNAASHAAYDAGVRQKDILLSVDGHPVRRAEEVSRLLAESRGAEVELVCLRDGEEMHFKVRPVADETGTYKAGLWLRDSVAGIGTLTYLDPATGAFGGLGHGICDPDNGRLMPCREGVVCPVEVTEIVRGRRGKPGEVRGYLTDGKMGKVLANTDCGVFGVLAPRPEGRLCLPVGDAASVHEGEATLYCQLDGDAPRGYALCITDVDRGCRGSKCFALEITDRDLLDKTGGIIQGMSGSPVVQDGRLIGAVTHVLVGEPNKGYGIFIRHMLQTEDAIL